MEENENNEVKNVEVESNSTVTDSNESTTTNNNIWLSLVTIFCSSFVLR